MYLTPVSTVLSVMALLITFFVVCLTMSAVVLSVMALHITFLRCPHSGGFNIVSCRSTYHVSVMYLTPVATLLSDVALLIMFL